MPTYRVTPTTGVPCLRFAANLRRAQERAAAEFAQGVRSVQVVPIAELADLAAEGHTLPVAARHAVDVFNAVRRERARAEAKKEQARLAAAEKANERREEQAAKKAALREQVRQERLAAKKLREATERREKQQQKHTAATQQATPPVQAEAPSWDDTRAPWEE